MDHLLKGPDLPLPSPCLGSRNISLCFFCCFSHLFSFLPRAPFSVFYICLLFAILTTHFRWCLLWTSLSSLQYILHSSSYIFTCSFFPDEMVDLRIDLSNITDVQLINCIFYFVLNWMISLCSVLILEGRLELISNVGITRRLYMLRVILNLFYVKVCNYS